MALYKNKLSDNEFHNYIKEGLALTFAKDGLVDFVQTEIGHQHRAILQDTYTNQNVVHGSICTTCTTANVLPCPTAGICRKRCGLHRGNTPTRTPLSSCPNNICHGFRDAIRQAHMNYKAGYSEPSWKNTDATQWCTDTFSIAKCFMPPDGYTHVHTYRQTDFNGILSIVINNMHFEGKMSVPMIVLYQAREIGRSSDLSVQDADLMTNIDTLITVLTDPVCLINDRNAELAVHKLQQLKQNALQITPEDVTQVLGKAIENKTRESKEEVEKQCKATVVDLMSDFEEQTKRKTKNALEKIDSFAENKTELDELQKEINLHTTNKFKDMTTDIATLLESKAHAAAQEIEIYKLDVKKQLEDMMAFISEQNKATLSDIFGIHQAVRGIQEEVEMENQSLFKEIQRLCKTKSSKNTENILLLGSAGSGKSSFVNTVISALSGKFIQKAPCGMGKTQLVTHTFDRFENCGVEEDSVSLDRIEFVRQVKPFLPNVTDPPGFGDSQEPCIKEILELVIGGFIPPGTSVEALSKLQQDYGEGALRMVFSESNPEWKIDSIVFVLSPNAFIPYMFIDMVNSILHETDEESQLAKYNVDVFVVITHYDMVSEKLTLGAFEKYEEEIATTLNIHNALEYRRFRWANYGDSLMYDNIHVNNVVFKFIHRILTKGSSARTSHVVPYVPQVCRFRRRLRVKVQTYLQRTDSLTFWLLIVCLCLFCKLICMLHSRVLPDAVQTAEN